MSPKLSQSEVLFGVILPLDSIDTLSPRRRRDQEASEILDTINGELFTPDKTIVPEKLLSPTFVISTNSSLPSTNTSVIRRSYAQTYPDKKIIIYAKMIKRNLFILILLSQ